jgi:hypothetical protein
VWRRGRPLAQCSGLLVQLESGSLELLDDQFGELVFQPGATLLDRSEAPAVVALAVPLGTAPALEADQALVHGLALPLVVDPDAVVVLVQVDRRVIAGLTRVAAVRLERGDGGARRNVRVTATSTPSTKPRAAPLPRPRSIASSPSIRRSTTRLPATARPSPLPRTRRLPDLIPKIDHSRSKGVRHFIQTATVASYKPAGGLP